MLWAPDQEVLDNMLAEVSVGGSSVGAGTAPGPLGHFGLGSFLSSLSLGSEKY